jgi:DNA-directed RNA polymerase subunit RPC12/RpoP
MDKVRCPYCGNEMFYFERKTTGYGVMGYYLCRACEARAPRIDNIRIDAADMKDAAYAAAMQRWQEPNRVLTLDEVKELNGCPVWCEDRDGSGVWALVDNGEDKCFDTDYGDWEFYCYGWTNERGWRAWTGKPTDEERKAVRWEDD